MRLEKCWFCSSTIYPGHGITFVRNDCQIVRFCRSKCRKSYNMKRNPRKMRWTKAARRVRQKDLTSDPVLEFEKRRNEPLKYSRHFWTNATELIKKIDHVKQKRQNLYLANR
ncbi:unnamed protein product [Soboliphyme baturini]|uniref:Probable ribosome biogenesis protein RLP24 n=1 Tax=Soboliphyme baturini TaxID=241478 RepID=A0A183J7I7_9BILA|nr:unnamed protein product [Soboliphyme baturini]